VPCEQIVADACGLSVVDDVVEGLELRDNLGDRGFLGVGIVP
jgi:hypothetical protein